jgi:hypothetical protein
MSITSIDTIRKQATWKMIYHHHCLSNSQLQSSLRRTVSNWRKIKTSESLKAFIDVNTSHGMLFFDSRDHVILMHSISSSEETNSFVGMIGNSTSNTPVEFLISNSMFIKYQVKQDNDEIQTVDDDATTASQTNIIKRVNSFFLVPPLHVYHMLDHESGVFNNTNDLGKWVDTAILIKPVRSPDTNNWQNLEQDYQNYWENLQSWLNGTTQFKHTPIDMFPATSPGFADSFLLTHFHEDVLEPFQNVLTEESSKIDDTTSEKYVDDCSQDEQIITQPPSPSYDQIDDINQYERAKSGSTQVENDHRSYETNVPTHATTSILQSMLQTQSAQRTHRIHKRRTKKHKKRRSSKSSDTSDSRSSSNSSSHSRRKSKPAEENQEMMNKLLSLLVAQQVEAQAERERNRIENERLTREFRKMIGNQQITLNSTVTNLAASRVERESNDSNTISTKSLWSRLPDETQLALIRGSAVSTNAEPF